MKIIFCVSLVILSFNTAFSQQIKGLVLSSQDSLGIEGSHILNITKQRIAISSTLGNFIIRGVIGDTLVISNVNYLTRKFIVNLKNDITVILNPNTIQLQEVIVSNLPVTEADFRQTLIEMSMQGDGKFLPFGLKPAKPMSEIPPVYNRDMGGLKYTFSGKKIKEKVKYYKIQADLDNAILRNKKYNREIVASLTELEGDDLTNFIMYMDLDITFITNSTDYEITLKIQKEFETYQAKND